MQLKATFMYGWNAPESARIDKGIFESVDTSIMDAAFEELIQRTYVAELVDKEDEE